MKKYLSKLAMGSALCASSMAFAAEPASLVLSDLQMDSVTAGRMAHQLPPQASSRSASSQIISQTQGNTRNVSVSPTVGVNVSVFGSGTQNVGSTTYQSGGTQTATNK
jgi:hypothetical protein